MGTPVTVLNTSILTDYGHFMYEPLELGAAMSMAQQLHGAGELESAVGHQATADILTELLGVRVPVNRVAYRQAVGSKAIVFKLNGRPEEGKILGRADIDAIGYSFGLLTRIE